MSYGWSGSTPPTIPGDSSFKTSQITNIKPGRTIGPYTTWKYEVKVATTAALTEPLVGLQTVDGVALLLYDRVLVKNQGDTVNGIYKVFLQEWQREQDMPLGSSASGATIYVNQGTVNANDVFVCTNAIGSDLVGTNTLVFSLVASTTGGPAGGTNGQIQYNKNGVLGGDVSTTDGAGHVNVVSLTASTGNVVATAGSVSAGTTVTAGTGITSTLGNIVASAGNVTATLGSVSAGTTLTAGTGITSTTGNIVSTSGLVIGLGHQYSTKTPYTQGTNPTTAVPITTNSGTVSCFTSTLAAGGSSVFTLTGAVILAGSYLVLTKVSYSGTTGVPDILGATSIGAGTATITLWNFSATAALNGVVVFSYIIV